MVIVFELLKIMVVLSLSFISIMFFIGGITILFADKNDYKHGWYRVFVAKTSKNR